MICLGCLLITTMASAEPGFDLAPALDPRPHLVVTTRGVGQQARTPIVLGWEGAAAISTTTTPFRGGHETLAIVLVLASQELFVGNQSFEDDEKVRTMGVLKRFEAGLDQLELATLAPPGSTFEVVTYATGTHVQVAPELLPQVRGSQLGTELDYRGGIGTDLVAGLEVAMHDLDQSRASIKLLYVFGDGNDTNNDHATHALGELGARALAHHINVDGVIWKTMVSSTSDNVVRRLVPDAKLVSDGDEAVREFGTAIERVTDRMYVSFDSLEPWDGTPHTFTLRVDGTVLGPVAAQLPDLRQPWWHPSWPQVLLCLGVVALIAAMLRVRR
ncbi:hypothetical protein BH11MYX1_BH11MYX1_53370 [soil metagenome]